MKRLTLFVQVAALTAAVFAFSAHAQQSRPTGSPQASSSAPADFVEGNLKFHRSSSGFMQVVDTTKNENAGTVIFPSGSAPVFASMPGYDLKSAYEKHMSGTGSTTTTPTDNATKAVASSAPVQPDGTQSAGFNAATKTVTLADGRAVTFVDNENLKVQMWGASGIKNYDLHFHKASGGSFMKGWAGREQGRVGGSLGGGGVTISLEGQNGTPGGEVYDTAKGTVYGNSGFVQAKAVTAAVREATDIVKGSAQPDLAKLKVVKSLLSNNLGM